MERKIQNQDSPSRVLTLASTRQFPTIEFRVSNISMSKQSKNEDLSSRARDLKPEQDGKYKDSTGETWDASDAHSMRRNQKNNNYDDVEGTLTHKPHSVEELDDRKFLQTGCAGTKKTRGRFIQCWKERFLWVSEDLLYIKWCHGKVKDWHDSDEHLTHCEVANIGNIKVMDHSIIALYLINDRERGKSTITFN